MKIYKYVNSGSYYTRTVLKDDVIITSTFELFPFEPSADQKLIEGEDIEDFISYVNNNVVIINNQTWYKKLIRPSALGKTLLIDGEEPWLQFAGKATIRAGVPRQDFTVYCVLRNSWANYITAYESVLASSYNAKLKFQDWYLTTNEMPVTEYFAPSAQTELYDDSNTFIINTCSFCDSDLVDLRTNPSSEEIPTITDMDQINSICKCAFPKIKLIVNPTTFTDSEVTIDCEVREKDSQSFLPTGELFIPPIKIKLETSAGYLPVNTLYTENGKASFKLLTNNVPSGTSIKIKANVDLFTNVASEIIGVA